ncbi:hypothetical protein H6F89_01690 [Cyanobacteria bacterium FACHB-63]|uniref:hypothetical protein n=1 Tax=unclassified Leptolyngbya TaxID=2650499 RepID=UPI001680DC8D|nr:hypothetical protein [Leptolyngbya sp. FACHB-17]MBD1842143.1 hypothetical protein [Cyanobacteria bacterium FACHB-63]MBD2078473.1 hypothetical protein [Leptolyngbya sp. FACHB-17]
MLKRMASTIAVLTTLGIASTSVSVNAAPARWEYQGVASTGEKVYLNLDSINLDQRSRGYFFVYQIGKDRPFAYTPCDGRFQVAGPDGTVFGPFMKPQSEATQKMLGRVCTYRAR